MKAKKNYGEIIFSAVFYIAAVILLVYASFNDFEVTYKLFNPESTFAKVSEGFGSFVYWGIWGCAFAIVFLCRRDLNESLAVIGYVFPFVKPMKNNQSSTYVYLNYAVKIITTAGFFVLCVVGWKKFIENVTKNILLLADKDNLNQIIYFAVSTAAAVLSILVFSKIDKKTLRKLEYFALAGVLFGIFVKIVEECKPITSRVRFREMVAYSNGYLGSDGLSEGKYSPLTAIMKENTDFSAFTPWYKKGNDLGIYNRADSFPSGHTLDASALLLSSLLFGAFDRLKKLAPFAVCVGVVYMAVIGCSRLVAGAHYLSDVAAACIIGYTIFLVVKAIYGRFVNNDLLNSGVQK